MIIFFKKIRQNLLSDGKIGKYLKYAVGEIILVVIGILLALQINNWNEQRKANKQELQLLRQLQVDVNSNLDEVMELTKRLNINKQGIDSLIAGMNKKNYDLMFSIFLSQTLRKSDFKYASSGYNLMQNGKVTLISDGVVLKSVLNIYENDLPNIIDRQKEMKKSIDFIQRHFVNKLFKKASNKLNIQFKELDVVATDLFEPINYNTLVKNIELKNTLIQLRKLIEARLVYLRNTQNKLNQTITLLNAEIELK